MGRKKSNYICPKCKRLGYLRWKPTWNGKYPNSSANRYPYVIHYDHETKSRKECSVNSILRIKEISRFKNQENGEIKYGLIQDCRRISVCFLRMMRMLKKEYKHVKIDNKDFVLLTKSVRVILLFVILLKREQDVKRYKQILGENDKDIIYLEKKLSKIRQTFERDLALITSLVSKEDLVLRTEEIAVNHYDLYHDLKKNDRNFIAERAGNFLYALKYGHAYSIPIVIMLEYWFLKYSFPEIIEAKKILREKQSESAFGSSKFSGTIPC